MRHLKSAYHPKVLPSNGRVGFRRFLQLLAIAGAVVVYLVYKTPYLALSPDYPASSALASRNKNAGKLAQEPLGPENVLEPKIIPLQIQNPRYNVRVIRSILQHSNTTWQDKPGEARGYFVQSLVWMQVIDTARPDKPGDGLEAKCRFPNPISQEISLFYLTPGHIHVLPTHPKDRNIGQHFAFYVDCEVPAGWQDKPHDITELDMVITMQAGHTLFQGVDGLMENTTVIVGSSDIAIHLTPPMAEHSEFAVCLSALTYGLDNAPLVQLYEWRQYMADIGVERVNWYGRDSTFQSVVDGYKRQKGGKDTFLQVPHLIWHPDREKTVDWEKYSDQDAWYMDCIMRNIFSSDFILVLDTDEYPMVDWRREKPLEQFKDFMRSTHASKGSIEMDRIGMARPSELGPPTTDGLIQTQYNCFNRRDKIAKSLYRAKAIFAVNQHKPRQRYPMPLQIAAETTPKPRPFQDYSWETVHSYEEDVWPKLLHYRWYNWAEADICTDPSPVADMPAYEKYLTGLEKQVRQWADYVRGA